MINLLQQMLLAGRNNNYEIILNILFVVVMAVFWIIGGVMKSKIKASDDKDKDKPQQKSVRMPSSIGKAFWEQFMELSGNPQYSQNQNIQAEKKIHPSKVPVKKTAPVQPKPKIVQTKAQHELQQVYNDVAKEKAFSALPNVSIPKIDSKIALDMQKASDLSYPSDYISFDDIDTDEIRKAIVYKEIFGAPVSMRDMA